MSFTCLEKVGVRGCDWCIRTGNRLVDCKVGGAVKGVWIKICAIVPAVLVAGVFVTEAQDDGGTLPLSGGTSYHVVKCVDYDKKVSYRVCSPLELKTLNGEIGAEARCFDKALLLAAKAWDAGKTSFPRGAIKQRLATSVELLASLDKANARQSELEKRLKASEDAEEEREEARHKAAQNCGGGKGGGKGRGGRVIVNPRAVENRKQAKADYEERNEKAISLFKDKLAEVMSARTVAENGETALAENNLQLAKTAERK